MATATATEANVEEIRERMRAAMRLSAVSVLNSTVASNAAGHRANTMSSDNATKATPQQAMQIEAAAKQEAEQRAEAARGHAAAAQQEAEASRRRATAAQEQAAAAKQQAEKHARVAKQSMATDPNSSNGEGPSKAIKSNAAASPSKSSRHAAVTSPAEASSSRQAPAPSDGPSLQGTAEQLEWARQMSATSKGGKGRERYFSKDSKNAHEPLFTHASSPPSSSGSRGARPIATPVSRLRPQPSPASTNGGPKPETSKWGAFANAPSTNAPSNNASNGVPMPETSNWGAFANAPSNKVTNGASPITRNDTPSVTSPASQGINAENLSPIRERKDSVAPTKEAPKPELTDVTNKLRALRETNPEFSGPKTVPDETPSSEPATKAEASNDPTPVGSSAAKPTEGGDTQLPSIHVADNIAIATNGVKSPEVPPEFVAYMKKRIQDLEAVVQRLDLDAERRKFLGTDSAYAPYNVKVKLSTKQDVVSMQVNATLTVKDLCIRVFTQEHLDPARVSRPRVKLGSEQLGHLSTLGEVGVVEGNTVDISFQFA